MLQELVVYMARRIAGPESDELAHEVIAWIGQNLEPDYAWPGNYRELEQCINRLSEIQRTVITLFYLHEKRVDEVARMLGIPEGTVKSHLHRARLALGEIMKETR